jgi:DNA-binding NarL/FixJ family response regulator
MTMTPDGSALLATGSRTLAIGLSALLLSIPPINHVELVPDTESLLVAIEENRPILIIVDTAMVGASLPETTREIRRLSPNSLNILLSENMAEFRDLVYHSDDTVIMKGTEPARLARTLEFLLNDHIVA